MRYISIRSVPRWCKGIGIIVQYFLEFAPTRKTIQGETQQKIEENKANKAASPSARRMLEERQVSQENFPKGSGRGGVILKQDVKENDKIPASSPTLDVSSHEEQRIVPMSRLRRTIAERLKHAQEQAVMLSTFNDVDMSKLIALRKVYRDMFKDKHNVRLGFLSFFVKASVSALREFPSVNAFVEDNNIIYNNNYHISVAVSTDKGLFTPVVRHADSLSLAQIEKGIADFAKQAQDGILPHESMQGGTFTISNGGVYGSLMSTPVLNPPQSAILGIHRIEERPIAQDGNVVIAPMMYLALTYDHRIIDGREAVSFLVRIKQSLEDPQRLFLDV